MMERVCPSCRRAYSESEAEIYCPVCGASLYDGAPAPSKPVCRICPSCGEENYTDYPYCPFCNSPMGDEEPEQPDEEGTPASPTWGEPPAPRAERPARPVFWASLVASALLLCLLAILIVPGFARMKQSAALPGAGHAAAPSAPGLSPAPSAPAVSASSPAPAASAPAPEDLFDESTWFLSFGQSAGYHYEALFHVDGSFLAIQEEPPFEGGSYSYRDGILILNFHECGNGCIFHWDGRSFVSDMKYPMQIGEDHYYLTPLVLDAYSALTRYYFSSPTPAPAAPETVSLSPDRQYRVNEAVTSFLLFWSRSFDDVSELSDEVLTDYAICVAEDALLLSSNPYGVEESTDGISSISYEELNRILMRTFNTSVNFRDGESHPGSGTQYYCANGRCYHPSAGGVLPYFCCVESIDRQPDGKLVIRFSEYSYYPHTESVISYDAMLHMSPGEVAAHVSPGFLERVRYGTLVVAPRSANGSGVENYYVVGAELYRDTGDASATPQGDSAGGLPAGCISISDGAYFGTLWSVSSCDGGWAAEISLETWDLYEDSYVRSLQVGDTVSICWVDYTVTAVSDDIISTDGGYYLSRASADPSRSNLSRGGWVACDPAGAIATYGLGTGTFFVRSGATLLSNAQLESQHVSDPFQLISLYPYAPDDGIPVYLEASRSGIDYLESTYHP